MLEAPLVLYVGILDVLVLPLAVPLDSTKDIALFFSATGRCPVCLL